MIDLGLTTYLDSLQAAWKGNDNDEELWYASFDGSNWSAPAVIPGADSDVGPALDQFSGLEYAAWKGSNGDPEIWYSSTGTSGWAPQQVIPGVASDVGPSLAQYNDLLYAAWKGSNGDPEIWYSSFDGSNWAPQQAIPGVGTSVGPSVAAWDVDSGGDGLLYAAWGRPRSSNWAKRRAKAGGSGSCSPSTIRAWSSNSQANSASWSEAPVSPTVAARRSISLWRGLSSRIRLAMMLY